MPLNGTCFATSAFTPFRTTASQRCARCIAVRTSRRMPQAQLHIDGEADWVVVDASLRGLSSENRMHSVALEEDGRTLLRELMHNEPAELSVVLCSDEEMTMLNKEWCGKDQPTDVLSFPQNDEVVLGDVVISADTARRQALERKLNLRDELRVLLVHGVLHLLGFDHETSDAELERMANEEQRLMNLFSWEGEGLISYARDKQILDILHRQ